MSYSAPSIDPADEGDLVGTFRHIFGKMMQGVDNMLPAKVISYDRTKNRATVQPLIMLIATNDETISRATLASVPVYQIGGGGFILNFNLKSGDLGWIKASDRDISLFLQSYKNSKPNSIRKHNFSDSVFFPDVMKGYAINAEDAENAVLQNLDGSVRVAIWSNKVKITSPLVEIDAPTTHITGAVQIDGAVTTNSTIVSVGDITGNSISLNNHVHPQGADSAGNTQQNTGVAQ